jgi:6-phospho 3-hexuloisomerase
MQEPLILDKIADVLAATDDSLIPSFVKYLERAKHIFVTGVGRSGLVSKFFGMRLMHTCHQVYVVGEVTTPSIKQGDLFLVISGSGATASLLPLIKKAKSTGAEVVVVSMKKTSAMSALADRVFALGEGNEYSFMTVQGIPMGTIFELSALMFLEYVTAYIVDKGGITEQQMRAIHANLE